MATAAETYLWSDTTLKERIRVYCAGLASDDTTEDANLESWLEVAAEACDDYVGWAWTDEDGDAVDHSPEVEDHRKGIKQGILEWIRAYRGWFNSSRAPGVTMVKTGPLQENYAGLDGAQIAFNAAHRHWQSSVYDVTLLGMA